MNSDQNKVAVLLVTYNHQKSVLNALKSIVDQKTLFSFDIIIADDASTDETLNFIKLYMNANQLNNIYFVPAKSNLKTTRNYKRAFDFCLDQYTYLSILEGDDFWNNNYKLQKHINFLNKNINFSMVFNRYNIYLENEGRVLQQPDLSWSSKEITTSDLIDFNMIGNFSTTTYRTDLLKKLPNKLFNYTSYDWIINIFMSTFSNIGYIPEIMSTYNVANCGVWSSKSETDRTKELISLIDIYDELLDYEYTSNFLKTKSRLLSTL